MVTRIISCPDALTSDPAMVGQCPVEGVTIVPQDGARLLINAPDEAAADAAEVWVSQMDSPAH